MSKQSNALPCPAVDEATVPPQKREVGQNVLLCIPPLVHHTCSSVSICRSISISKFFCTPKSLRRVMFLLHFWPNQKKMKAEIL